MNAGIYFIDYFLMGIQLVFSSPLLSDELLSLLLKEIIINVTIYLWPWTRISTDLIGFSSQSITWILKFLFLKQITKDAWLPWNLQRGPQRPSDHTQTNTDWLNFWWFLTVSLHEKFYICYILFESLQNTKNILYCMMLNMILHYNILHNDLSKKLLSALHDWVGKITR